MVSRIGFWAVLSILGLTACGKPNVQPFLGTWTVSGNGNLSCTGASGPENQSGSGAPPAAEYNIAFAAGTSADLVSMDSAGCQLLWKVDGDKASLEPSQTCELGFGGDGPPAHLALDSQSTITLTTTGQNTLSGTGNVSGTLSTTGVDGKPQSMSCQSSGIGTLTRE